MAMNVESKIEIVSDLKGVANYFVNHDNKLRMMILKEISATYVKQLLEKENATLSDVQEIFADAGLEIDIDYSISFLNI